MVGMLKKKKKIQDKFDSKIKYRTLTFLIVTESAVLTTVVVSIFRDTPNCEMYYDTLYLPFDSSTIGYWSSYVFQITAQVFGSLVNVAHDTLIPGMMLKICAQLSILEHRLDLVCKDVDPYDQINRTNKIFSIVMLYQFSISTIVICITIYTLYLNDPEFFAMVDYFMCMTVQIFDVCIAASTECNIKSVSIATAVYQSNWYNLDIDSQKSLLLLIMTRSSKPLKFNAAYTLLKYLSTLSIKYYSDETFLFSLQCSEIITIIIN
ncbi:GSCOCT00008799001.2-RA-CDS [Cotesia congregata]|uniref:Olfactory receptor 186 n=1 Tax=Cotesia congregata TaxID=51543 RepID=A0A8J2HRL3_COTCN|nr:GSCOCT00008799001.2-RA-CDS [Cotesia congregata]CAG5104460.1 olfactory receptor 186 [Cotesia congregata]